MTDKQQYEQARRSAEKHQIMTDGRCSCGKDSDACFYGWRARKLLAIWGEQPVTR